MDDYEMECIRNEIKVMKELQGEPGIINFRRVWEGEENLCIVMDYVDMDLYRYINKNHNKFTQVEIRRLFKMIAIAL